MFAYIVKMVRFILVLILFELIVNSKCSASSPTIINIKANRNDKVISLDDDFSPKLEVNQPFTIHVHSPDEVISIRCQNKKGRKNNKILFKSLQSNQTSYYAPKNNITATAKMNTTWTCFLNYPPNGVDADFFKLDIPVVVTKPAAPIHKVTENSDEEQENKVKPTSDSSKELKPIDSNTEGVTESSDEEQEKKFEPTSVSSETLKQIDSSTEVVTEIPDEEKEEEAQPTADYTRITRKIDADTGFFIHSNIYRTKDNKQLLHATTTRLQLNEPFIMSLKISKHAVPENKSITRIICRNSLWNNETYVNETLIQPSNASLMNLQFSRDYTFKILNATPTMNGLWRCKIYSLNNFSPINFSFTPNFTKPDSVPDNSPYKPLQILVNEKIDVKTKKVGMDFDAQGQYFYSEGELAKIECKMTPSYQVKMSFNSLYCKNYLTPYSILPEFVNGTQTINLKLLKRMNGCYIICHVKNDSYVYKARLSLQAMEIKNIDLPTIQVNGLSLVPIDVATSKKYKYEYYDGENLTIIGSMENTTHKWRCSCGTDSKPLCGLTGEHESINYTVALQVKNNAIPYVSCNIGSTSVLLEFAPVSKVFDPYIKKLSSAQTLFAYKKTPQNYITMYNNTGNKVLNLNCDSDKHNCSWYYNNTEVISECGKFDNWDLCKFKPLINIPVTVINCTCNDYNNIYQYTHTAEIVNYSFKQKTTSADVKDSSSPSTGTISQGSRHTEKGATSVVVQSTTVTTHPGSVHAGEEADTSTEIPGTKDENKGGSMSLELLIGIILGALLFVVLIVWIVVSIHKRKRKLEQKQEANLHYENLPEHNKGVMATPAQCDTYSQPLDSQNTYSDPSNYVYATPQPRRNSEVGLSDPKYATVLSKEPRTEYANIKHQQRMPEYGQVQPKALRNSQCAPQVLPSPNNDNYAQVLPKAVRNNAKVFNNQTNYVNTQATSDYAEPAYCELNKL